MKWMTKKSIVLVITITMTAACNLFIARSAVATADISPKYESKIAAIESITASGDNNETELVIKLTSPATYTSYKTTSPLRLVVDLSQTTQGAFTAPIVINKGNFKTVTVSRYDMDAGVLTRIDIELVKDSEAIISTAPDQKGELRISFPTPPTPIASTADTVTPVIAAEPVAAKEAVVPESDVLAARTALQETAKTSAESPTTAKPATEIAAMPATYAEPVAKPVETAVPEQTAKSVVETTAPAPEVTSKVTEVHEALIVRILTAITVKDDTILLAIAGWSGDLKSFRLNKPERFVVDLYDVKNKLSSRVVPINASSVALARVGVYPDKVRVVFDAINGSFPEAAVTRNDEGVAISLNAKNSGSHKSSQGWRSETAAKNVPGVETKTAETKPAIAPTQRPTTRKSTAKPSETKTVAEPVPASSDELPAVKPSAKDVVRSSGPASVEVIDFQIIDGISRVAVKVKGDVVVDTPVKSPGFVTLTIKNAGLPKRLQRSLETQEFVTPVLRVTPILTKTRKGTDTRIRIALRQVAPYEFRQEGDMLFIDFKNPNGMTAEKPRTDMPEPRPQVGRAAKAAASDAEISPELAPLTEPGVKPLETAKSYKGRKVTLEFADAEVRKIFQLLSEVSNKNFVLGDDVGGTISIKLVNVPWDQALDIILDTKGLDKREDGNIVIIKGKGKFKTQAEEELEIKKQLVRAIELKTETFSVNYADIGSLVSQFSALKTERGTISPDPRTNKIIVKDIPQALEDMRKLKEQLDVPEKQVMIEARIVEATSTFTRNLGVSWGVHYRDGSASFLGINSLDTGFGGLTSAPPTTGTGTSAGGNMGISFGTLTSNIQLDMRLNAAASAGLIKIISTPKVATLNNKTAKISQGQQIPYQNTTATTGAVTAFVAATLSLEVTPHINSNGTIGMKIDAKNDAPGAGSPPPINTKSATTELLLRDGETTVIGGIYVDSDTEADDGVPFLMDIPFLGKLFKSNNKQKTKTELLIFITPRILGAI